jgi:replication-associated recombination protein RarA
VVYLAVAPKSNAVYKAWNAVRAFVKQDGTRPVPMHLRNAPTQLMKELGHGAGYRYAHDEAGGFAAGETLPARRHGAAGSLPAGARAGWRSALRDKWRTATRNISGAETKAADPA